MTGSNTQIDVEKAAAIAKIRRLATGILIGLTLIFAATFFVTDPPLQVLLLRAMAEAGMVGGLADWFAVEALFRHPLRIPIPHTALLPKNQRRAAGNIARFIDEHFLNPDQLRKQLNTLNPIRQLANWLVKRENAQLIGHELKDLLHLIVRSLMKGGFGNKASDIIRKLLLNSVKSKALSGQISNLLKNAVDSHLLDDILSEVKSVLAQNRDKINELVEERSRWWIAPAVDRRISKVLVDGVLSIIDELADPKSELRQDFGYSVQHMIDDLQKSGRIAAYIDEGKEKYANSKNFNNTVEQFLKAMLEAIDKGFDSQSDEIGDMLVKAIEEFGQMLVEDPNLEQKINDRLLSAIAPASVQIRPTIVKYIEETIVNWDSDDLVIRLEAEVGRDLQFIRINGAVLGAFVGGLLFLTTHIIF